MSIHRRALGAAATLTFLCATLAGVAAPAAHAVVLPAGFAEQIVFSGLTQPTNLEFAPDGRIFVAEKGGAIKVFDNLTDTTPTVFANLAANVHNQWDRGLLGLALPPNFPASPWVYVLYTYDAPLGQTAPFWNDNCNTAIGGANGGNCIVQGRLSRLQANGNVMTGSEQVLIQDWCQQFPSHSIGDLGFGADGMLYVSAGDGASFSGTDIGQLGLPANPCGDPANAGGALRAQDSRTTADPTSLDGTVLRLDPATGAAAAGNPNLGSPDLNIRRIVAQGLRNPYRFTMKPGTNEVWAGDVGWGTWEEIDRIVNPTAGVVNFGWPCYEGNPRMSSYDNANVPLCESLYTGAGQTAPYFTYNHASDIVPGEGCATGGDAVSGAAFYPSSGPYPAQYRGALFFADYSRGCIWAMKPAVAGGLPATSNIEIFAKQAAGPADLEMGPGSELYYADLGGTIRRIRYTAANQAPTAVISANPTNGIAPLTVSFGGMGSTDPNPGDTLTYQWDFTNDGTWDSASATASNTYTAVGTFTAKLRVTDNLGAFGEATVQIQSGNTAPTAVIDTPAAGLTWKVGDNIPFTGHGTDPQQGSLPASALSWQLRLQHCATPGDCHTHVLQNWPGVASGSFLAPDHEYPSYVELVLTATDAQSLSHTVVRRLDPQTVQLTFQTNPSGLQLTVGSFTGATPFTREVIVGSSNTISAPTPQAGHQFSAWSDGGAQTHVLTAPALASGYTATYTLIPADACASSAAYQCTTSTAEYAGAANELDFGGDDFVREVVLPFAMPVYGTGYTTAWIDTNGSISFLNPGPAHPDNVPLPAAGQPNAAIYAFWDDLFIDGPASIRTESQGSAPNRRFIVEWRDAMPYGGTDRVSVSVVMQEDGVITLHYSGIDPASAWEKGNSATIGVEDATGTNAVVYAHNQPVLVSGKAITYTPPIAPATNIITGLVTQTGAGPAPGVAVTLGPSGLRAVTDANGSYTFSRVPAGSYTVTASGACIQDASASVLMDSGTKTADLTAVSRSDGFGYQCAAATASFVSAANQIGLSGDDSVAAVTLPFAFPLYGTGYTTAWIDTNGYVSFANPGEARPINESIPRSTPPNAAVYAFWDDLVIDGQASVRTETVGTAPNRKFVVEWRNAIFYQTNDRVTFSLVLGEDGSATAYYSGIDASSLREQGESGTFGLENVTGGGALQFAHHQPLLGDGYVIRYWKP